jgi:acyl-coenzyme A thioesterase PaaI-like protein
LKTPPRYAQRRVRQVDGGVMSTGANEAFGLAAASATDFEHPQAAGSFKADRRL